MEIKPYMSKTLYFDDLKVGDCWYSHRRTITAATIEQFNTLCGLDHPAFVDEEFMKEGSGFKGRVASGVMMIPFAAAQFTSLHIVDEALVAMVGMDVKIMKPLYAGDTIYTEVEVVQKKELRTPDRGIVFFKYTPINQKGERIAEITEHLMVKRKAG
jgi:acyl dehydratase